MKKRQLAKKRKVEETKTVALPETMLMESTEPPHQLWVRSGRLWVKSTATTNKKISKDLVYKEWTDGQFVKTADLQSGAHSHPYDMSVSTTLIYAKKEQKVTILVSMYSAF